MQKRVSQVGGDYCFNLVNSLIDYKGDVARNGKRGDGQIIYSPDFSPNNIRRLILSADGVRIDFHVSVDGKLSKVKPFSDTDKRNLNQCLMLPDYKPMIWALADRVCSSIEEVIICTQNSTGADLSRELNFEGLLRNRVGNTSDVKHAVSSRYKRLAYFTIVNCDISTLVKNTEVASCNSPFKMISETEFVKSCASVTKFKEDWYNYYGHTSAYSLDSQGSRLNEHFKKVRADIEDGKKKSAVNDLKEKRLKGVSDKFEKAYRNYEGVYSCISKLNVIVKTEGTCYFSSSISEGVDLKNFRKPEEIKNEFNSLNSKDDCEEFVKKLTKITSALYSDLARWFFDGLYHIYKEYPITVRVFLDNIERCITVPPNCQDLVSKMQVDCKGVNLIDSVSNVCCYACIIFITDVGQHDMSKYYKKDIWLSNFKGGTD